VSGLAGFNCVELVHLLSLLFPHSTDFQHTIGGEIGVECAIKQTIVSGLIFY